MRNSRQVPSLALWDEFAGSVDDAIFDCNAAARKAVWELAEASSDHLRVQSAADASLAVNIEFFPGLRRAVALFSPSGVMRVYDFGSGRTLTSSLGPDAIPASPQSLGRRLLELIPDPYL